VLEPNLRLHWFSQLVPPGSEDDENLAKEAMAAAETLFRHAAGLYLEEAATTGDSTTPDVSAAGAPSSDDNLDDSWLSAIAAHKKHKAPAQFAPLSPQQKLKAELKRYFDGEGSTAAIGRLLAWWQAGHSYLPASGS
jgi:hypothetical protein